MTDNENLIKLVSELQNKIELLENRIKNLENNKCNENTREIDLDMYINMLELTSEDLNMVLTNNFCRFIKIFIKKNNPPLKRENSKIFINVKNNWEEFKKAHSDKIMKNIHIKLINKFTIELKEKDISLYINKVLLLKDNTDEKVYQIFKKYDK